MNGEEPYIYKNGINDNIFKVNIVSSDSFEIIIQAYSRLVLISGDMFTIIK